MTSPPVKLLLVAPDELVADLTAFRLEMLGYQVIWSRNVSDAANHLQSATPPAVVLLDTTERGVDLLAQLQDRMPARSIPILVLSHDGEPRDDAPTVDGQRFTGVADMLTMPYDPPVLEGKLRSLVEQSLRAADSGRARTAAASVPIAAVAP